MTKEKLNIITTQENRVTKLEGALTWIKNCRCGDASLIISNVKSIRDLHNFSGLMFIKECVDADTYDLILAVIEDEIKTRLDVERKIFKEM